MRVPRTDRDLAALRGSVPDGVIDYLARVPEEQRADLFSTVAVLDGPADLTARVVVTDGAETVDFGTPLYDEAGAPRALSTAWDVAAEPEPGWAFLYEVVSDGGGCAVVLNYAAGWVPAGLREEIAVTLGMAGAG